MHCAPDCMQCPCEASFEMGYKEQLPPGIARLASIHIHVALNTLHMTKAGTLSAIHSQRECQRHHDEVRQAVSAWLC